MKQTITIIVLLFLGTVCRAQVKAGDVIDGAKTLVELVNIFKKKPKVNIASNTTPSDAGKEAGDSCDEKQLADLCFKNSSAKSITISIYKKAGESYSTSPFTIKVLSNAQECWYELKAGIYKYKIEVENAGVKSVFREGDIKLNPCDKMEREITE